MGQGSDGPIRHLSAVTLATADMARSVAFYEAMGFDTVHGGAGAAFTSFAAGSGFLNVQLDPDHVPERIWGRAIFWVDDVDRMYSRARRAGYEPHAEPVDAPWSERYFHITDPDGHEISFARPLESR